MRSIGTHRMALSGLLIGGLLLSGPLVALDLQGTTEWGGRVILSTTVSGMVSKVNVAVGDEVAKGAVLVELDPRGYRSRLAAAESLREATRQLNEEARRELDRSLELYDRTMLSDHQRKLAEIEAAKADAALREAEAKLAEVQLDQDYSRVNAPFDGRVVVVHVQAGETVVNRLQSVPLVTLVDHRKMLARTQVDERVMRRLAKGDKVQIGVRGVWLDGVVAALSYDPVSQTNEGASYQLDAQFSPAEGMELRSGEKLVLRLPDE
jgi:RND family efflux transporter MFP subunit